MKRSLLIKPGVMTAILLFVLQVFVPAQEVAPLQLPEIKKPLTAKDKEAVIEIFKTINERLYSFEVGGVSYGKKDFSPSAKKALQLGKQNVLVANSIVANYVPKTDFWYVISKSAAPANTLEGILGKANTARLNALINKYTVAEN